MSKDLHPEISDMEMLQLSLNWLYFAMGEGLSHVMMPVWVMRRMLTTLEKQLIPQARREAFWDAVTDMMKRKGPE